MMVDESVVSRATDATVNVAVTSAYSGNGAAVSYSTASVSAQLWNLSTRKFDDLWYKIDSGSWVRLPADSLATIEINFATQTLTLKRGELAASSLSVRLFVAGVPSGLYARGRELGGSVDAAALAALGVYPHLPITTKTTNYTAVVGDRIIFVDATSGNVTITLPAANASGAGYSQSLRIKRIDDSANVVTVQSAGGTIDGETSTTIAALQSKDFSSNGVSLWGVC